MSRDANLIAIYLYYYKPLKAFLSSEKAGDVFGIGKEKFKRQIEITGQIVRQIDRALKSLDVTQRQIIKETYINDQDPAGVVEKLGYSSRHYRRLRTQALKALENEFTKNKGSIN